jgi:diaminopimelate decarboxylase
LNKGDPAAVHKVGAYNMTQWMQFIQMRPKVVMIDMQSNPHVISDNKTIEALERMPENPKKFNLRLNFLAV